MTDLYTRPEVLALLDDARQAPEDDAPRLVLADFLEDQGDVARAEFIRLQCRLAPGAQPELSEEEHERWTGRMTELLSRYGGGWAGPLWRWGGSERDWHRGLLSFHQRRRPGLSCLHDVLPWIDTVLLEAWSWQGLERAVAFLNAHAFNHVVLDLRRPFAEEGILTSFAQAHERACLRSLTIWWQPRAMARRRTGAPRTKGTIGLGARFFAHLAGGLPVGRHLTHFGSPRQLPVSARLCLRAAGIQLVLGCHRTWPHALPASAFRRTPVAA